ncbi:30S ribosome-binding factor RbfA [Spiroplasma endosymbiont of Anurida maritima]|uniref:30S ribosome-binding factor RbfA n=1 Tax=Spiroplasma endosymbiont of Anurida maritima TaxID=2967972 RepID=UPI0036D33175
MAKNIKIEKLESIIMREVSQIIRTKIKDIDLINISLIEVNLTADKSMAKIYYSLLMNKDQVEKYDNLLNGHLPKIKSFLAKSLDLYKIPKLSFVYDNNLEKANNIEDLIKKTSKSN